MIRFITKKLGYGLLVLMGVVVVVVMPAFTQSEDSHDEGVFAGLSGLKTPTPHQVAE